MSDREQDIDPRTGRQKPRMRTEDLPSYTPQGRTDDEPGKIAREAPNATPQGRADSTSETNESEHSGRLDRDIERSDG